MADLSAVLYLASKTIALDFYDLHENAALTIVLVTPLKLATVKLKVLNSDNSPTTAHARRDNSDLNRR